jgi:hypothetical protein
VALASSLAAADLERDLTAESLNGYGWHEMLSPTPIAKLAYISGLLDSRGLWEKSATERYSTAPLYNTEVVQQIDRFYADATNRPIPVWLALRYVHLKLAGATPAELAETVAALRRAAAEFLRPTP